MDPIFSNVKGLLCKTPIPILWSDHFIIPVIWNLPMNTLLVPPSQTKARCWSKLPLEKWAILLEQSIPNLGGDPLTANDKFNLWIDSTLDLVLPKRTMQINKGPNKTAWYTSKLTELKQKCKKLERIWRRDFSKNRKTDYREAIKSYKMEIKNAQASYYEKMITLAANSPQNFPYCQKTIKSPDSFPSFLGHRVTL